MSSNRVEKANKIMQEGKGTCSQAIFAIYGEYLSSGKVDYDTCMKIASGFGGGIASTGNVCGALTGAIMALGLRYGGSRMEKKVNDVATKLLNEFQSRHGTVICRELIEQDLADLATEEDLLKAYESGAFNKCMAFVNDVGTLIEELIKP